MKLYHAKQSRSVRPRWLLEELGVPYDLVTLDMSKNEHKAPDYVKIHPHGAVPALVDGDTTVIESAAICAYLADKFPEKHLAPPIGSAARGHYGAGVKRRGWRLEARGWRRPEPTSGLQPSSPHALRPSIPLSPPE